MTPVCAVSDLHLFCRRSLAFHHMSAVYSALDEAAILVLNGDIFDFRWSTFSTVDETAREAIRWLESLVSRYPDRHFHYVLGNHDNVRVFTRALEEFADDTHNLDWHPYHLRLGNAVFFHGDVANRRMDAEALRRYRMGWRHDERRGALFNRLYDMAFALNAHRAISRLAFPPEVVVERLTHYLENIGAGPGSGTDEVYFGHTHVPMHGYEYRGMRFHNSGAPMPGMRFNVLRTEVKMPA